MNSLRIARGVVFVCSFANLLSTALAQSALINSATGNVPLTVTGMTGTTVDIFRVYDDEALSFYVDSAGATHVTGALGTASDRRLKHNFSDISDALGKVLRLRGVEYNYNETLLPNTKGKRDMGFVAQEVKEVEPLLVKQPSSGDHKEYYHVEYPKLSPLLVEAVKDLHGLFEDAAQELEGHVEALKAHHEAESKSQEDSIDELEALLASLGA